jgi:hypothetical protein
MTVLGITRNGYPIDPSTILRNVEIVFGGGYGLDGAGGEASSATFQLVNVTDTYDVAVGDVIQISATLDDDTVVPRFTGRVYSRRVDFEDIDSTVTTVSATGNLALLERARLGFDFLMPETTDGDRLDTVFALGLDSTLGLTWTTEDGGITFPETTHLRDAPIGEMARVYALDALGLIVDLPDGSLAYYDRYHARNVDPVLELDASNVLAGLSVENSGDALINTMTVFYGLPDIDGNRDYVTAGDEVSRTLYGQLDSAVDSQILNSGDALDVANEYIYRNSRPRDNLPALSFTDELVPDGFVYVGIGEVVRVTGLPQPLANTITGVITGYREAWDFEHSWQIDLEIIDGRYWGRGTIWDDVPIAETWDTLSTFWTWDNFTEYTTAGFTTDRWKDTPANYTYTKLSTTTTSWDDWSN